MSYAHTHTGSTLSWIVCTRDRSERLRVIAGLYPPPFPVTRLHFQSQRSLSGDASTWDRANP